MRKNQQDAKTLIVDFDSLSELADTVEELTPADSERRERDGGFYGGESWADAMRHAVFGNPEHVAECESILERVQDTFPAPRRAWRGAVAGAFPCVPAFLSGEIECMRKLHTPFDQGTPIRIVVDVSCDAGAAPSVIRGRGIAAAAIAAVLSQSRIVECTAVLAWAIGRPDRSDIGIVRYPVPVAPLDLAYVCNALAGPATVRRLCFAAAKYTAGCSGSGIPAYSATDPEKRNAALRAALNLSESDILVPRIFLDTIQPEYHADPVSYVLNLANHMQAIQEV